MGLFNFLKAAEKETSQVPVIARRIESNIIYTHKIIELFEVEKDKRDSRWEQDFYYYIQGASLQKNEPEIITGPDGFSYFILQTPRTNEPFESYCIQDIKDNVLLNNGLGVVINPAGESAEWVFSHGDIVNLYLNNEFVSEKAAATGLQHIDMTKQLQVIKQGEEVMIGQPSERYLPKPTRKSLKKFLQTKGITRPMIMLLCRRSNGEMIQELGINVHPEDFPSVAERDYLMQQIAWFLPRHYLIISFVKSSPMAKYFMEM